MMRPTAWYTMTRSGQAYRRRQTVMLEHAALLLGPWRSDAPAGCRPGAAAAVVVEARPILDAVTHQHLGLVRRERARGWPMLRWLTRQTWHVLESEDESLLLTLYGPWGLIRPW